MLIEILGVILLLGLIVMPLIPRKAKTKRNAILKVDTDTRHAEYAINANGKLEKIPFHQHY
jgi:hypothetical protein